MGFGCQSEVEWSKQTEPKGPCALKETASAMHGDRSKRTVSQGQYFVAVSDSWETDAGILPLALNSAL